MGKKLYKQRDVYETMLALLDRHGFPIPKNNLKSLLGWVSHVVSNPTPSSVFTPRFWDKVSVKLYDLSTLPGHEPELRMLPARRAVMDAIKKEGGSREACEATACEATLRRSRQLQQIKTCPGPAPHTLSARPPQ